ncbi:4Fe-4S binding protein [Sulfuriflexus mobilis]|uniref:4Fe-4S binding protein n=1 Tax=Sulfuriflexus mobilis TaxID=1811807 RepID=UPI0018D56226|nr:4Fe-4S binding protein [Sulfuriflexus mobilis]
MIAKPVILRHLNKLRWLVLTSIFLMLVLLPFIHLYQTYVAAHAYDLLYPNEKLIYDSMEWLTAPFVSDAEHDLDVIKGTTWSGNLFGLQISDPLAVLSQISASLSIYWPFVLTALVPLVVTAVLGRVFCGWICPATFIYELNDTLAGWLRRAGVPLGDKEFDKRTKYLVLAVGLVLSMLLGSVVTAAIYPPAIIGRELYYAIAQGGFGVGAVFFILTILFDLLVARRGFCRYVCAGGALYSLLGRYRLLRIQRVVSQCNDCKKCNVVCEFGLDPLQDGFGQECNNCTACIAVCPTDALEFRIAIKDIPYQGPGHLGQTYRRAEKAEAES